MNETPLLTAYSRCQTEADTRAYMLEHHPHVKAALAVGVATVIRNSDYVFMWFGDEAATVRFSLRTYLQWGLGWRQLPDFQWPRTFALNRWRFALFEVEADRLYATYRRDLNAENVAKQRRDSNNLQHTRKL